MNDKILTLFIGALLGGIVSFIGFYLKNRRDIKEKINESLFQLLEVWSLIAMVKVTQSTKFTSLLIEKIKEKFPQEDISEKDKILLKSALIKSLPLLTGANNIFNEKLLRKYKDSVTDLAKIYPLLAFSLNQNQMLIQFLEGIDKLSNEEERNETDEIMLSNIQNLFLETSFDDLELDLIKLASKSGRGNKVETKKYISHIRNKLNTIPGDVFDEYINIVIAPAIQAHYDALGVENPNVQY